MSDKNAREAIEEKDTKEEATSEKPARRSACKELTRLRLNDFRSFKRQCRRMLSGGIFMIW